jgi:hypothetical protein
MFSVLISIPRNVVVNFRRNGISCTEIKVFEEIERGAYGIG